MLYRRGEEVPFIRVRNQRAMNRRIITLRPAARENNLTRIRIDERRDLGSSFLDVLRHLIAKRIGTRRISPVLA